MDETIRFRSSAQAWAAAGPEAPVAADTTRAIAGTLNVRQVVLVEGVSDQVAVETLAALRGRDLEKEGIVVLPIGGATSVDRFLRLFGPPGLNFALAGLCDASEESFFQRGLSRVGVGAELTRTDLEQLGFFVCVDDLEDELIRALGAAAVERVVEQQGDLRSLQTLQRQPAQRGWTTEQHLRRFMGSIGGRKARYARALITALENSQAPRPLEQLVAHLGGRTGEG